MLRDIFAASNKTWNFWVKTKWMPLVNVRNRIWGHIFSFGRHGQTTWIHLVPAGAALQEKGLVPLFRPFGVIKSHKRCGSRMTTRAVPGPWYFLPILCSSLWVSDVQFPAKDNRLRCTNKWIKKVMILLRFHFLSSLFLRQLGWFWQRRVIREREVRGHWKENQGE